MFLVLPDILFLRIYFCFCCLICVYFFLLFIFFLSCVVFYLSLALSFYPFVFFYFHYLFFSFFPSHSFLIYFFISLPSHIHCLVHCFFFYFLYVFCFCCFILFLYPCICPFFPLSLFLSCSLPCLRPSSVTFVFVLCCIFKTFWPTQTSTGI